MAEQNPTALRGSAAENEAILNLQMRTATMAYHVEKERGGAGQPLPQRAIEDWARADAADFSKLRDGAHDQVLPVMANNMRANPIYQSTMEAESPEVALRVAAYDRATQSQFEADMGSTQPAPERLAETRLTAAEMQAVERIVERHEFMAHALHTGNRFSPEALSTFAKSDARDFALLPEGNREAISIASSMHYFGEQYPEYRSALEVSSPQVMQRIDALHGANEVRQPAAQDDRDTGQARPIRADEAKAASSQTVDAGNRRHAQEINSITEGKDRELPPDRHGEILRAPTPAAIELGSEILQASAHKEVGQGDAMRERSSVESRTELRLAAANEAMRANPALVVTPLAVKQDIARRWVDLDVSDFGRMRSDSRRESALEAIAGHVRASPEYADELKKRSPVLAESARAMNEERAKVEREAALPSIERNGNALAARALTKGDQRELAQQDAKSLAVVPAGHERHLAAAVVGENAHNHAAYREELERVAPQLAREASAAAIERGAVRAVERGNDDLLVVPRDTLTVADARAAVRQDVAAMGTIKDEGARYQAAVSIGDNARNQAAYRAELQIQAPQVAKEAQAATAENDRRIAEKENRNAAEFAAMQLAKAERAAAWTPEQAADQARKDVASLRKANATDRHHATGDMVIAADRSKAYGEALAKEAPDVAREVEGRRERDAAERAAAEQRKDSISAAAQSRAILIDAAALAAVANVRTRETARVVEQLASSPATATQQLRDAQQALKAPPRDGRVTAPNDPDIAAQRARAIKRPVAEEELSQALLARFIVSHEKRGLLDKGSAEFTFRNGEEQGRVAFVDAGKALSTERDDKATIRAMVEVATAKNWKEITVSGTDNFRQNAWLEASLSGIKVRGYEPREADKQILAELQQRAKPANVITAVEHEHKRDQPRESGRPPAEPAPQRKHIDGDALTTHEKTVLDVSVRSMLESKQFQDQVTDPEARERFAEATFRELEAKLRGERVYVGEIVEHGKAPYQFNKDNDDSYYVTLKTRTGEQVIWGKGLAEAMQERSAGEQVVLQNIGKRDVTVLERVRDAQGHIVNTRPKESQLNTWKSELLSRFSEKARTDFANRSASRQPSLGVYDPKAPRAPAQPAAPARTPDQQRNAEQQRNSRER
jgi:hypothetical protein